MATRKLSILVAGGYDPKDPKRWQDRLRKFEILCESLVARSSTRGILF